MRIVVATVNLRGSQVESVLTRRIRDALGEPPWGGACTVRHAMWSSGSLAVRMDVVTNEPPSTGPLIHRDEHGQALAWTGHIDDQSIGQSFPTADQVARLPGRFALVRCDEHEVAGFTAVHRLEPLYIAEGYDVRVLSTSARIAQRVAGLSDQGPSVDVFLGLSGAGYMLNDETPFAGVKAMPADAQVSLRQTGADLREMPQPDIDMDTSLESATMRLSTALVQAAQAAAREPWERIVHVTGGRDSRLAAAAFAAAGVEFSATTTGIGSHPDVILGQRIASTLGISHQLRSPGSQGADFVEVIPLQRAHNALVGCEGMITAYETISLDNPYADTSVTMGGHGGELLRAGFGYLLKQVSTGAAKRRLELRMAPHRELLRRDASERLDQIMAPWRELADREPLESLERFYREYRVGRWNAVANSVYSIAGPRRSILLDNQVVRNASAVRKDMAADERLIHSVIHQLRPDLCSIPLFPRRWKFEKEGPSTECYPHLWAAREPLIYDAQRAWNWRVSYSPRLHDHFAETILDSELCKEIFVKSHVEQFLNRTRCRRTGAQAKLAWSLYTACLLRGGLSGPRAIGNGPTIRISTESVE